MLLTWNEERNVRACLGSLARQTVTEFEVVLLDAASTDRTLAVARDVAANFPVPLRIETSTRRTPIGEARNLGVALAQAPLVAFLSADAELDERWVEEALLTLEYADMAFSRQVHAPHAWSVGAAVRGLRYHFPRRPVGDALPYASNVAAAYQRDVLAAYPFDAWANAAEDLLFARRAAAAGFLAQYNPNMVVRHHDVPGAREEMRKNVREGEGWGLYRDELGLHAGLLAWGALLAVALAGAIVAPLLCFVVAALLWAPALRRGLRRRRDMPAAALAKGVLASPPFDVAFLVTYLGGLLARERRRAPGTGSSTRTTPAPTNGPTAATTPPHQQETPE